MSPPLISRSQDLKRLRDEGYALEIVHAHLVIRDVPYVTQAGTVERGTLVSNLSLAGDVTQRPQDHVMYFAGEKPHDQHGNPLDKIINSEGQQQLAPGIDVDYSFSSKPAEGYADYHHKATTYIGMLAGPAQAIDPQVTPRTYPPIVDGDDDSPFHYLDSATSRAGIAIANAKLALGKVGIAGLGGSGSYVLDLIAKTPIREIHLFDGDTFHQHNAFRSPGAPGIDLLRAKPNKATYFADLYSPMREGLIAHTHYLEAATLHLLDDMDFVFLCLDSGESRRLIVDYLEATDIAFIDVGMGVTELDGALGGVVRVTTSTADDRAAAREHLPLADLTGNDNYARNIQVADLNALNAAMAVVRWKRLVGFYRDYENEHHSTYTIDTHKVFSERTE